MSSHNIFNEMGRAVDLKEAVVIPTTNVVCDLQGMDFPVVYVPTTANVLLPNLEYGKSVRVVAGAAATATVKNAAGSTIGTVAAGASGIFTATATSGTWDYFTYGTAGVNITVTNMGDIYTTLTTANYMLGIPITSWREVGTGSVGTLVITDATPDTGGAGLLGSTTAPTLLPTNGATDPTQIITWASSDNSVLMASVSIPSDFDTSISGSLAFGCRIKSGGTTNAVGFTVSVFSPAGADIAGTTTTNQTTAYLDRTATLDISGGELANAKSVTVLITPVAHTSDTLVMQSAWLVGERKLLTS